MLIRYTLVILSLTLVACSAQKGKKLQQAGYVKPGNTEVKLADAPKDSITLHYFSCGGFYIERGGEAILIDPFASNPKPLGMIKPNHTAVDSVMYRATGVRRGIATKIKAVLAGHAHYDHLMDVPYIMDNWVDSTTWFAGNNTAGKMVKSLTVNTIGAVVNLDAGRGEMFAGNNIRITPILLSHPPHIGKKHLYKGEFDANAKPWQKKYWQGGQTYGFIIDFFDAKGKVDFRIYMQTSAGLLGLDNVPPDVMRQHSVDLMIIPAALFSQVKGYPQKLVSQYHPKHIVVCHWENFFKPMDKISQKPYTVSMTNVYQFAKQLDYNIGRSRFTIPMPDSKIKIRF